MRNLEYISTETRAYCISWTYLTPLKKPRASAEKSTITGAAAIMDTDEPDMQSPHLGRSDDGGREGRCLEVDSAFSDEAAARLEMKAAMLFVQYVGSFPCRQIPVQVVGDNRSEKWPVTLSWSRHQLKKKFLEK